MQNQTIKSDLLTLIEKTEDVKVLEAIKTLLQTITKEKDFWDELPEFQKESIGRGLKQAAAGETRPHEDVMKKYEKWLTK